MKPTFTYETDFRQERNFGAKIGATLEFIGAHWRPLFKCLLYFVLPPALLMGIGMGLLMNELWNQAAANMGPNATRVASAADLDTVRMASGGGLVLVGGLVALLLLTSTVYAYLRARLELAPELPVTPGLVWQVIRQRLGRIIGGWLLLLVLSLAGAALSAGLIAVVSPGVLFLLFLPLLYLMMPLALYFPILWLEDLGLVESLRRCFYLIYGKWWSTLGLLLVIGFIQGAISIVFILPQYASMLGKILKISFLASDVFGMVAQCLYVVGLMLTYSIPLVALAFQYFNLVERRDGVGLRLLVDQLGQAPARLHPDTYRADDEGEY